jgi:hypothetical protein
VQLEPQDQIGAGQQIGRAVAVVAVDRGADLRNLPLDELSLDRSFVTPRAFARARGDLAW